MKYSSGSEEEPRRKNSILRKLMALRESTMWKRQLENASVAEEVYKECEEDMRPCTVE